MTKVRELLSSKYIFKSAVDGRFVSRAYALLHPRETFAIPRHRVIEPMEERWP